MLSVVKVTTWATVSTVRYQCVLGHLESVYEELLKEIWSKVPKEHGGGPKVWFVDEKEKVRKPQESLEEAALGNRPDTIYSYFCCFSPGVRFVGVVLLSPYTS